MLKLGCLKSIDNQVGIDFSSIIKLTNYKSLQNKGIISKKDIYSFTNNDQLFFFSNKTPLSTLNPYLT